MTTANVDDRPEKQEVECDLLDENEENGDELQTAYIEFESATHFRSFEGYALANLSVITARNVGLRDLDAFVTCSQLIQLDVSCNQITNLEGIYHFAAFFHLNLSNNDLSWTEVGRIAHIHVALLSLRGNMQLENDDYYREQLVDGLKHVWMIDGIWITAAEKAYVKRFFHLSTFSSKGAVHRRFSDKNYFVPTRLKADRKMLTPYASKVVRLFSPLEEHTLMLDRKRLTFVIEVYEEVNDCIDYYRADQSGAQAIETISELIAMRRTATHKFDTLCLLLLASMDLGKLNMKLIAECLYDDSIHLIIAPEGRRRDGSTSDPDEALHAVASLFLLHRNMRCQLTCLLFACVKIEHENATFRETVSASLFDDNVQLLNAFIVSLSYVEKSCNMLNRIRSPSYDRSRMSSSRSRRSPEMMYGANASNGFAVVSWQHDLDDDAPVRTARSSAASRRTSRPRTAATSRITSAHAVTPSTGRSIADRKPERISASSAAQQLLRQHVGARLVLAGWLIWYLQRTNKSFLEYVAHDQCISELYNLVYGYPPNQDNALNLAQAASPQTQKEQMEESARAELKSARISPTRVKVKGFPLPPEPHCFISAESLHRGLPAPPSDVEVEGLDIEARKPKLGQKVLLNTLTVGEISAIPDSKVILVRLTSLPDAPQVGPISQRLMKSPGYHAARHFMYVNFRNLSWDKALHLWRPRGTTGDKFSLHYTGRPVAKFKAPTVAFDNERSQPNAPQPKFRLIDLYGAPSMYEEDSAKMQKLSPSPPISELRKQRISDQLQSLHLPAILQSSASHLLDMLPNDLQDQILSNRLSLLDLAAATEQAVKQARIMELRKARMSSKVESTARTVLPVSTLTFHMINQEVDFPQRRTIVGSFTRPPTHRSVECNTVRTDN